MGRRKRSVRELFSQGAVQVEGGADEREMCKCLRKVSKGLAMMTGFFSVES
jgi:hypothetical protein